jgi:predicted O-methyltransferase YrrM
MADHNLSNSDYLWKYFHDPKTGHGIIKGHLLIMYSIVMGMKAKNIVEVGMRYGDSTRALLYATQRFNGRVTSVDVADYPETLKLIKAFGLDKYHNFIKGRSTEIAAKWNNLNGTYPIDILLLDGGHQYKEHKEDFEAWYPHVRPGGLTLIHDVNPDEPHGYGYEHFKNEVLPNHEAAALMFGGGLGIVRKPCQ